jgi:hypothetical protein
MTYNDASKTGTSHYDISHSPVASFTKDTYQNGDYRVIIWDFEDPLSAPSSSQAGPSTVHPQDASMFQFSLFCNGIDGTGSQITADNNSGKLGSANVSFMVCGMVLSDERLLNITLPIDISRTSG